MGMASTSWLDARPGQIFNNQTDAPSGDPLAEVGQPAPGPAPLLPDVGQPGFGPAPLLPDLGYLPDRVQKGMYSAPPPPSGMEFGSGKGGGKGNSFGQQIAELVLEKSFDTIGQIASERQGETLPGPDVPVDQVLPPEVAEPTNPEFAGGLRPAPRNFRLPRSSRRELLRRRTAGY